jgi:hypothetical protein
VYKRFKDVLESFANTLDKIVSLCAVLKEVEEILSETLALI